MVCELLRLYGVLRSSASGRGTSKRKEGYVVLLLPAMSTPGGEGTRQFAKLLSQEFPSARLTGCLEGSEFLSSSLLRPLCLASASSGHILGKQPSKAS